MPDNSNTLGTVSYKGEKMSFEVTGADVREVIQNIAEQSGVNLVMDSDVKGTVNLRLRNVPWDQALMVLLKTNGLGYVKEGNVLRIAKQQTLSKEAQQISSQIENEKKARELAGGIKVKYIPVSYADVADLEKKLKTFSSAKGKITHDERTSSIVITDYEEYIARMTKLVTALDIPPMQVEIESKLIEAREEFVRAAGINWDVGGRAFDIGGGRTGRINAGSQPFEAASAARGLSLGFEFGTFDIFGDLTATLGLFERQNKIKVLSQPKVQTLNKAEALIENVTQVPIRVITNQQGITTETITFKDLILLLKVKPQITFRGDVIMDVELRREFAGSAVEEGQRELNRRRAKTSVMVKNGKTAVIGGIYQLDDTNGEQGVPWLKDIPIIGYFFKQKSKEKRKSELLLFLKPNILKDDNETLVSNLDNQEGLGSTDSFEEMSVDEGSLDDSSFEEEEEF
ncbi:MAG: type IV pilus secretin PilQ [Bdellovibrionales bacterium]|nr:type IV pilus secretin PilQ [Bdellovibrionales bacterium]